MQYLLNLSFKTLRDFLFLLFVLFILSSCHQEDMSANITEAFDEPVLRIAVSPWPPDAISYLAKEMGFFDKYGVNAEIVWIEDYEGIFEELDKDNLHIWTSTFPEALRYKAETGIGDIVFLEDISVGADAVVTLSSDQIQSIPDLVGKKVGVENGTVSEFFLQVLLDREGIQFSDLEIIDIPAVDILESLKNGEIDSGVCYEPCTSNILNEGGRILIDTSKERGLIVDVYVVRKDHLEAHKDIYANAFKAISDAQEYFNQNPRESMEIMKEILNLSMEEMETSFSNIDIPNLQDNQAAFNRVSGFNSLYNLANLAGQYLEYKGLIEVGFDTDQIINRNLIEMIGL